jgi:hypothetical protein
MTNTEELIHELRMNCDHDAANLIEELQARCAELERERDELLKKLNDLGNINLGCEKPNK